MPPRGRGLKVTMEVTTSPEPEHSTLVLEFDGTDKNDILADVYAFLHEGLDRWNFKGDQTILTATLHRWKMIP